MENKMNNGKLVIKDLCVNIGDKEILKGINLEINKGEIVALMGQNGAGKSTIGMTLMGYPGYTVTKGEIIYDGENILEMSTDERAKKGLFFSMIHPNILAFYFFNEGIEKRGLWKIVFVPLIMTPYGLFLAYLLYFFSDFAKQRFESPLFLLILIIMWLTIAFIIDHKRKKRTLV